MRIEVRAVMVFAAPAILVLGATADARAQVHVTGTTFQYKGGEEYDPLQDVKIEVIRKGSVFLRPPVSQAGGSFGFEVPAGQPFSVLFFGGGKVPELQQLAGPKGIKHDVHVALLTPQQYVETYGQATFEAHKARILGLLAEDPSAAEEIRRYFSQIR
jgi:hypothetical protein